MVRKKLIMIKSAMIMTKRKLEKVSKPSHAAKSERGWGRMAIMTKTMGRSNQATELFMDIEFFFMQIAMTMKRIIAAMVISICKLLIFPPS